MTAHTDYQVIRDESGKPAFVVIPYARFQALTGGFTPGTVPNAVVGMVFDDGLSPIKAWREYLRLTQAEVAERLGISQAAYAQMESAKKPRKVTRNKIAKALGIELEQLDF
ncbi:MAG: DNA-binding protein [Gammaproteobacteria bacterium BRH_c0]|nr:MAG: DNA-binding protein [Gammaproteobacteria bacterium BRH_c0]